MGQVNSIDNMEWESGFIAGKWRFVDHANKLLSVGWLSEEDLDIEKIRIDTQDHINAMRETYLDYIG